MLLQPWKHSVSVPSYSLSWSLVIGRVAAKASSMLDAVRTLWLCDAASTTSGAPDNTEASDVIATPQTRRYPQNTELFIYVVAEAAETGRQLGSDEASRTADGDKHINRRRCRHGPIFQITRGDGSKTRYCAGQLVRHDLQAASQAAIRRTQDAGDKTIETRWFSRPHSNCGVWVRYPAGAGVLLNTNPRRGGGARRSTA